MSGPAVGIVKSGKWEMENGKFRNCVGNCKRCQMPEASQGADILPIEQIYKGGVPLFEERGTALIFTYSLILSFKRAYKKLLQQSLTGGGEFSTRQRSVVEALASNVRN